MIKSIVVYSLSFAVLFFGSLLLHQFILDFQLISVRFQLTPVYIFFAIASFLICIVFKSFTFFKKTKEQLGFLYLFTLFLKIIVFTAIFYNSIIGLQDITKIESLNLLIPLFVFLALEVVFIAAILNQNPP
ncbi:DUF6168 family protein [Tamlana sp. 2201CG12-4]|uniref:DUF6168 family protein n=1 Tax=Tamlana sp. 2201CG12-4 TaxID=3112582 RepID=UPI002DBEADCD|nr:DUF6168 family protein [Tamlana sp. 2201CG12-4]MEC3906332.1 DUF6168 family protein [Tamlana sp. 2201CG12-4]